MAFVELQVTQLLLAVGKLNWYQTHSYAKPTTTTGIQAGRASQERAIMGAEIFSVSPLYLHPGRDQSRERGKRDSTCLGDKCISLSRAIRALPVTRT